MSFQYSHCSPRTAMLCREHMQKSAWQDICKGASADGLTRAQLCCQQHCFILSRLQRKGHISAVPLPSKNIRVDSFGMIFIHTLTKLHMSFSTPLPSKATHSFALAHVMMSLSSPLTFYRISRFSLWHHRTFSLEPRHSAQVP